ncbi:MAG TPA: histidine kinase dimerization/phosphoacceptor domain -containing protein [bacterium]
MKPLSILYLEDNDMDVELVESRLDAEKIEHRLTHAKTAQQFVQLLQKNAIAYDIMLVDYSLPGYDGLSALKKAKAVFPDMPVIIFSGAIGEEIAIETLKQGATDYVLKHRISQLIPAIRRALLEKEEHRKRKEAEEKIQKSLQEKEILLREIHHRVKNNLQIMYSLLNLQSRQIQDDQIRDTCRGCKNRIYTMSLVHEQLYLSENLSSINFKESIEGMINKLFKPYLLSAGISMKLQIEDVFLPINISIPLSLIVNELIDNAIKYAFPDSRKSTILVALRPSGKKSYEIVVQDNGVGLPASIRLEKTKTMGLHLVNLLVQQIEGKARIQRKNGTAFKIEFPFQNP